MQQEVWISQQRDVAASLERTMGLPPGTALQTGYQQMLPNSLKGMSDEQIKAEVLAHVNVNDPKGQAPISTSDSVTAGIVGGGVSGINTATTIVSPTLAPFVQISPQTADALQTRAIQAKDQVIETAAGAYQTVKNPEVQKAFGQGLLTGAGNVAEFGASAMVPLVPWSSLRRACGFLTEGDSCTANSPAPASAPNSGAEIGAANDSNLPSTSPLAENPQGMLASESGVSPGALQSADNSFFAAGSGGSAPSAASAAETPELELTGSEDAGALEVSPIAPPDDE